MIPNPRIAKNCTLCPLHETAQFVGLMGAGPTPCKVLVLGEAPGQREDDEGRAFVGRAGEQLNEFLGIAGLSRDDVYITNAVRCRPPGNRTPTAGEVKSCSKWLKYELSFVKPKYILALGGTAVQSLIKQKSVSNLRGTSFKYDDYTIFVTYHPAFSLYMPSMTDIIKMDFRAFGRLIRGKKQKEDNLDIRIVQDKHSLYECIEDLEESEVVGWDTETSGLNPYIQDRPYLTSVGFSTETTQWTIPLQHQHSVWRNKFNLQRSIVRRTAKAIEGKVIVSQSGKFDTKWTHAVHGVLIKPTFDTMLAHYLLDENSLHDLEHLAQVYFGAPRYDIEEKEKHGFGDITRHCEYLGRDVYYTRKLYYVLSKELSEDFRIERLFYRLIMRASWMYTHAEMKGIWINPDYLEEAKDHWEEQAEESLTELDKLYPSDNRYKLKDKTWRTGVNWNSPRQLGKILFDEIGLDPIGVTKTGQWSTTEGILLKLARDHQIPSLVLKYREATKMLSTFVNAWDGLRDKHGRVHPHIKIHGTTTGRPSMEEPNFQQTPRVKIVRRCVDAPSGKVILEADESQVEMRLAAEYSGDKELLKCFAKGIDVHLRTTLANIELGGDYSILHKTSKKYGKRISIRRAMEMGADKLVELVPEWEEERKKNKSVNFGYLFGMGVNKFIEYAWEKFQLVFTYEKASLSRKAFFDAYPSLTSWHEHQRQLARNNGFVTNIFGRKRRLPDAQIIGDSPQKAEAERQAINAPIQGSASDINLAAAVELFEMYEHDPGFDLILTVHDNILAEVDEGRVDEFAPVIKRVMAHPSLFDEFGIVLSVPLEADVKAGPWGSGKKL